MTENCHKCFSVMLVDDDEDDYLLFRDAIEKLEVPAEITWVSDPEEVNQHLLPKTLPDLIFLDLNMPRKDGFEVLTDLKKDKQFCLIPVIVLTTSNAAEDVERCYLLGVNSYMKKPNEFSQLHRMLKVTFSYWFETALLPKRGQND
ncbi:response regulator [Candidatus Magnetomonas plexicatena]|uniref:response regulator n=1 Tax=Candidatus Magnetomonas plexicatena TaxID=2552947 RepID=UPI001103E7CF|nr:response regulator [Nitrospirales bacterium LBB_01]